MLLPLQFPFRIPRSSLEKPRTSPHRVTPASARAPWVPGTRYSHLSTEAPRQPPRQAQGTRSVSTPREGFPIPGKPRLPPIQPQHNPQAGSQLPASTLCPTLTGGR